MLTKKEDLEKTFLEAKEQGLDVCVEVTVPGQRAAELIINRCESIDNKLAYYLTTYNDDLVHNHNEEVKIVGFSMMKYF